LPSRSGGDGTIGTLTAENHLIAALPINERAVFLERAKRVTCELRESIFEINEPFERVMFPISGMGSVVTVLKDGTMLEAQTVGREGFFGLPLFHGLRTARAKGMCQIEGEFYQLKPDDFLSLLEKSPVLERVLHRYSQFSNEAIAQTAACNSMHLIEQRCARWLLTTADAVGRKDFNLTQEFLSQMLAVRRPGVTVAIGGLERQGLIEHRYGKVSLTDVEGLKKVSCECYQTLRDKLQELLGQETTLQLTA
jgi:CRP-like cAMP-binding protein